MDLSLQQDKTLTDIVGKLKIFFKPEKVYLFGSRAKGLARENSDYDLFIIVKSSNKRMIDRMIEANDLLWGRTVPVDVFVYTESEFNDDKDEVNSIAHAVATEGVEI